MFTRVGHDPDLEPNESTAHIPATFYKILLMFFSCLLHLGKSLLLWRHTMCVMRPSKDSTAQVCHLLKTGERKLKRPATAVYAYGLIQQCMPMARYGSVCLQPSTAVYAYSLLRRCMSMACYGSACLWPATAVYGCSLPQQLLQQCVCDLPRQCMSVICHGSVWLQFVFISTQFRINLPILKTGENPTYILIEAILKLPRYKLLLTVTLLCTRLNPETRSPSL